VTRRLLSIMGSAALDGTSLAAAYFVALAVRNGTPIRHLLSRGPIVADWSLVVMLVATVGCLAAFGLYKSECYVYRPLLLRTLVRASTAALVVSAVTGYFAHSPHIDESRFLLLGTFALFVVFCAALRLSLPAAAHRRWVTEQRPLALVIGQSPRAELLTRRLSDLPGFSRWRRIDEAVGVRGHVEALEHSLDEVAAQGRALTAVFIDADGVPLQAVLPLIDVVRSRRACAVYVMSDLLRPLHSNRLLFRLFEAPVMRIRDKAPNGTVRRAKRALDLALASLGLVVTVPVMAVIAVAIKLTSRGPVFYRDERIGLRGRPFTFLKFRTMVVGNDASLHRDLVTGFVRGDTANLDFRDPEEHVPLFKIAGDDRVTAVGRFLRRYSLDELPQLWNVVRGDMSLVGPRPPLPYEVAEYTDWQRQRLRAVPGVSGLWQVGGRSRVSFDEMVFQDVFYSANQSPLVDVLICLRTVGAVLNGRGAM